MTTAQKTLACFVSVAAFAMSGELLAQPELFVSEFSLTPSMPVQGQPVSVRVGVYNRGLSRSGPFTVEWWPGENYTRPALTWRIDSMAARGGRILTGTYSGYPSWYGRLTTKAVVDSRGEVAEENEGNNTRRMDIRVRAPQAEGQPDLYISEFSLDPPTPVQGRPVTVRIGVYNRGTAPSDACLLEWWAGSTFARPANTWRVAGLAARGGRIFTFTYPGYQSWYANMMTKAAIDTRNEVAEQQESNNESSMRIRVVRH